MAQHHLHTFANTEAFVDDYNSGKFGVPYVAVIDSIKDGNDKPLVLYSNRLPYKDGQIAAPQILAATTICGQWILGASKLP